MRYFLDAEFNGFSGDLISLALVPEDEAAPPFYEALPCANPNEWVAAHVMPVLNTPPIQRAAMVAKLAAYIANDDYPIIVSDWPEDIAHLALMLMTGPGWRMPSDRISFELLDLPLFDSESSSAVPHNAFHDAVAFRNYMLRQQRSPAQE